MLDSPKWQTMWMESQHCTNNVVNISLPYQQAEKMLEDIILNCSSPNKGVQLEALKCWGCWINNQSADNWNLKNFCYTSVRPLITKKLQPLHKDVDICKLKLSLMWKLLGKVQHLSQLEGPQYILEVFLQSCLVWLSSTEGVDNEISVLIFQLFLILFKKTDELIKCDKDMFLPLTEDLLESKKVFQRHVDKFLNVFVYWRKLQDKTVLIVVWKCFLEHCERFCDSIPIRIWHEVFKTVGQICSETNDSLKERLAFLHGCATTLDSVLSSSKFIDFGNLLTTPCEALLKKLLEVASGTTATEEEDCRGEGFDPDVFVMARDVCRVLSMKSVLAVGGGYDLCNYVLDALGDFSLKSLFWGVWCGLVDCYESLLSSVDRKKLTKTEMKFYRKLRGVAVNFDLDREDVEKDCASEVQRLIRVLKIDCLCHIHENWQSEVAKSKPKETKVDEPHLEAMDVDEFSPNSPEANEEVRNTRNPSKATFGKFSTVAVYVPKATPPPRKIFTLDFGIVKDLLKTMTGLPVKSLLQGLFRIRVLNLKETEGHELVRNSPAFGVKKKKMALVCKKPTPKPWFSVTTLPKVKRLVKEKERKDVDEQKEGKKEEVREKRLQERKTKRQEEEEVISTPKTRSKRKAEEEEKKREIESMQCLTRRRRKSFEILVQEIVKKNQLRKTEKCVRRKSPLTLRKREKMNKRNKEVKETDKKTIKTEKKKVTEKRRLKKEPAKTEKEKKVGQSNRKDGKLENYFKVLRKTKTRSEMKNQEETTTNKTKKKMKTEKRIADGSASEKDEGDKKEETGWKQTSLKSMMTPKKEEKVKQTKELKNKVSENGEEKKKKKKKKKLTTKKKKKKEEETGKANANAMILSPFKEVLHDHEYAKMMAQEYLPRSKQLAVAPEKHNHKPDKVVADIEEEESVQSNPIEVKKEDNDLSHPVLESPILEKFSVIVEADNSPIELPTIAKVEYVFIETSPDAMESFPEVVVKTEEISKIEIKLEVTNDDVTPTQEDEEATKDSKNRKRKKILMMDSVKPSKRPKREENANEVALEVVEKENMEIVSSNIKPEVNVTPTKETGILSEKSGNSKIATDTSPITSRAMRMIALLPDSTKGGQVHRNSTSPKMEARATKGPSVDKSSRASKMLALVAENVVEPMDWNEDVVSEAPPKPSITTPVSILSTPKTVKKRKSISFDEAKNETFIYEIGTPPCQIWRQ